MRPRLDAPDPSVDPRFRFNVSVPPVSYVASTSSGWDGARTVEANSGFVRSGEVHNDHEVLVVERWITASDTRPIGAPGRWRTSPPGTKVYLPGEGEHLEWRGRPLAQFLFLTPERVEAVLGKPWSSSGFTRLRGPRRSLPFVDHVIAALMHDVEAGHPAGPITGDALLVALMLHLGAPASAAPAPRPGALGRRLDVVREYIDAHLARPLRLDTLAALAGLEPRRFAAVFTAETGCPPARYVLLHRLARARRILRDPELTLDQVALAVGFTGAAQLSRAFHDQGEAPGAFRRH